ncbi:cysteine--tRNA ligase [Flavobacterium psychrophilum]|nr:cysteine--tRNA ligase [Flavobacterium psychrophilum]
MLQAHYRSNLDFTNDAILAAEKGFYRLMEAIGSLKNTAQFTTSNTTSIDIKAWKRNCYDAMNDDFNTPILIAHLFEGVRFVNVLKENKETITTEDLLDFLTTMNAFVFDVLGLEDEKLATNNNDKLDGVVEMLIQMRKQARDNKDFAMSDQIRDQLLALGIQLKDSKEGTTFSI